jgi:hypothetical protein
MPPLRGEPARTFRKWCGLGGGAVGAIVSATSSYVEVPRSTVAEVRSTEPALSSGVALALLVVACAVAVGVAVRKSVSRFPWANSTRTQFAAMWGIVALCAVASNAYLMFHPGPDWWYSTRTIEAGGPIAVRETVHSQNPYLVNLFVTFIAAGFAGGVLSALILRSSWLRSLALVASWTIALGIGALVAWFGSYLITLNVVHMAQAISLSPFFARLLGMFLAGFITGYGAAAMGSVALPHAQRADSSRSVSAGL